MITTYTIPGYENLEPKNSDFCVTPEDVKNFKNGMDYKKYRDADGNEKFVWAYPDDLKTAYRAVIDFASLLQDRIVYLESAIGSSAFHPKCLKQGSHL